MKTNFAQPLTACIATAGLAIASSLLTATQAQAFSLSVAPEYGTTNGIGTGATATLDFNFVQSGADLLLNLGITNTTGTKTTAGGATNSSLVAVAFDVLSGVSASVKSTAAGSTFTKFWQNVDISGLHNGFDYGISTPRNTFNGGNANGGLYKNQSTLVSFLLTGSSLSAAQAESAFLTGFQNGTLKAGVRFQQVDGSRVGTSDKVMAGVSADAEPVPEPTTIAGMVMGLGSLVAARRKQAKKATA
ncbi:PEP-CTERM sorting domain-containing protein [Microcoleus vaginatus GB1-A2]|uniref:PEP-CTERM sorting domain-containing protein n=1 Tax=Microcoleus vaginatus TaxID=119532 RepID=UPI001687B8C7|nr:PEP-CTERM sorting domain-containing protein [Microcoleus sp. FACHB-61]